MKANEGGTGLIMFGLKLVEGGFEGENFPLGPARQFQLPDRREYLLVLLLSVSAYGRTERGEYVTYFNETGLMLAVNRCDLPRQEIQTRQFLAEIVVVDALDVVTELGQAQQFWIGRRAFWRGTVHCG